MSINIVKECIKMEQPLTSLKTQIMVEGDLIVPDVNPDIKQVLQKESKIILEEVNVTDGRVNYNGKIEVQILYISKGSETNIYSMQTTLPIEDFVMINDAKENMDANVALTIQYVEYKVLNDRKLGIKGVVNVEVNPINKTNYDVVKAIENIPENQIKKRTLEINKNIATKLDRILIKDELVINSSSSNIKNLLQTTAKINNKEVRVSNGKVTVRGDLVANVIYKGENSDSIVETVTKEIGFNGNINIDNATDAMYGKADLIVTDCYTQIRPDEDGEDRVIEIEVSIGVVAKVENQEKMEILEDGYCINKELVMETEKIKYPKVVCRNKNQSTIKEVIEIEEDALQVFRVTGNSVIDDIEIIDDRVIVEGIVNINILYIAENDSMPVSSYSDVLPFKQVIEGRGIKKGVDVKVVGDVEHIGFNMLNNKEVELRILMDLQLEAIKIEEANVIVNVEEKELEKEKLNSIASITVYIVQKNDTLWNIAKNYNTSIEDLIEINEIENEDLIFEGQKIIILKKVV